MSLTICHAQYLVPPQPWSGILFRRNTGVLSSVALCRPSIVKGEMMMIFLEGVVLPHWCESMGHR